MTWTLCTSGAAIAKAGLYANATLIAYAGSNKTILDNWSDESEAFVCDHSHYDWVTNSGSLTTNGKQILSNIVSGMIAEFIIAYDTTAYSSGEAVNILNVLDNQINKGLALIKDDNVKTYLKAT